MVTLSYELQVAHSAQRAGLGRLLIECLWQLGRKYGMQKIMLTALRGMFNDARRLK